MDIEENAKILCSYFQDSKPFLIGRNGSTELQVLQYYMKHKEVSQKIMKALETYSGVFPASKESVLKWINEYIKALESADVMAEGWYEPSKIFEKALLDKIVLKRKSILLRNLEPYYVTPELRWSQYLANKRVGIISSFANICEEQTYLSKAVWNNEAETLLPSSTQWIPIQTYYPSTIAGTNKQVSWNNENWEEAVETIVQKYKENPFDIALVGCGALGMIIGAKLKALGVQVIIMGGAIQILFGIRGKRWENHSVIKNFFNDAWIYPPEYLKPSNSYLIEDSCYWG